jgi:hypothetical protein
MKNMREMITLMEGVMAVPGLGQIKEGNENSNNPMPGFYIVNKVAEMYMHGPFKSQVQAEDRLAKVGGESDSVQYFDGSDWSDVDDMNESVPAINSCNQDNSANCRTACAMEESMSGLTPEQIDQVSETHSISLKVSDNVEKAKRRTIDHLITYGIISNEQIPEVEELMATYDSPIEESAEPGVMEFESSAEAYDACQTGEAPTGTILVIPSEGVVGISDTWPVAVTNNTGKLHGLRLGIDVGSVLAKRGISIDTTKRALEMAKQYDGKIGESFDLQNGYDDANFATGNDYFPDGADSPVVDATGPSGARHGDNPEQKKMQVAETHKELVYNYRNFLKESARK